MYKTTTFKISGMILLCIIAINSIAFCQQVRFVEIFKTNITADDGQTIILKQLKDPSDDPWTRDSARVQLFDKNETKLLGEFTFGKFLFPEQTDKYAFELKKVKDYKNVTLYDFIVKYTYIPMTVRDRYTILPIQEWIREYHPPVPKAGDTITYTLKLWIDKDDGEYSGSLTYTPFDLTFSSFESYDYYTHIKDVVLDLVKEEFDNYRKDFEKGEPHEISYYFQRVTMRWVAANDQKTSIELQKQFDDLKKENSKVLDVYRIKYNNKIMLSWYTSSISTLQKQLESNKKYLSNPSRNVTENEQKTLDAPERPEVAGELPVNEEELEAYKMWAQRIFFTLKYELPHDEYGTLIKFELTGEGLTAMSAGPDKIFGTDDDMSATTTYESVGMIVE